MAVQRKAKQEKAEVSNSLVNSPFLTELVAIETLHPHPRNYQSHPEDELEHLMESLRTHGLYRPIVVGRDNTILAGHGIVAAARKLNYLQVPVIRKDYAPNDPRALKLLAGDNEIRHLAEVNDRVLTELLRELADLDELLGTGYNEMMLANLTFVTRPAEEVEDLEAAAQWVGMPEYDIAGERKTQIIVNFVNDEDRREFCRLLGLDASKIATEGTGRSIWWPKAQVRHDLVSLRFTDQEDKPFELEETDEEESEEDLDG